MTLRRGGKYIIKIARVRLILLRSSYYPQTIPLFLESHHGLITTFNRLKWAKSEKKKYDTKTDPLRFKRAMVSTKKQSFKRLICSWLTVIASIVLGHACISHLGSRSLAFLALVSNRLRWRRLLIIDRRNPRLVVDREYRDLDPERRHLNFVLRTISISPFPSGSFVKYVPILPNPHPSISPVATLCRFSGGRGEQHSLFLYLLRPEERTACNSRLFVQLLTSFRSGCSWRGESLRLSKRISALPRRNV